MFHQQHPNKSTQIGHLRAARRTQLRSWNMKIVISKQLKTLRHNATEANSDDDPFES